MCDLFKTKPKKGTMRKEKPKKNQTQKQFVLIFCHWNRTTDNTHTHTLRQTHTKATKGSMWKLATMQCICNSASRCEIWQQSTCLRPFLSDLKLQTGNWNVATTPSGFELRLASSHSTKTNKQQTNEYTYNNSNYSTRIFKLVFDSKY